MGARMRDSTRSEHPLASAYVETKIGMLPSSWEVVRLEELSDPSAPIRYGVVQIGPDTPDGIPIVPIKHINRIDGVVLHRVSPEIEAGYAGSRVKGGDVLVSVKGTIGAVGVVPNGFEGNIAREIARIRPTSACDATFLAFQLEADDTQRRIDSKVVGTTRLEFSIHAVRDFLVALPPLPEQRAIAALLSTWNSAIDKTEQLVSAKERHYSHELSRLFSEGGTPLRKFRIGDISYVPQKLSEAPKADDVYVLVRLYCKGIEKNERQKKAPTKNGRPILRRNAGELLVGRQNIHNGGFGIVPQDLHGALASNAITSLSFHPDKANAEYVFFFLSRPSYYRKLERVMGGTGQKEISESQLLAIPIPLPDIRTQTAIARYLTALREEIDLLGQSVAALKTQKRGLMQKLLTGQWRLPVQEEAN